MKTIFLNSVMLFGCFLSYGRPIDPPVIKVVESEKTQNQVTIFGCPVTMIGNAMHCGYNKGKCATMIKVESPIDQPVSERILVKVNDKLGTIFTASSNYKSIKDKDWATIVMFDEIIFENVIE